MHLKEYIKQAKEELDAMQDKWEEKNKLDPEDWPMEMSESDWGEQELAERFS